MKALNLYPTESLSRMAANIVPGITDKRFLELEIKKWLGSEERRKQIQSERYYDGGHDILSRLRTVIDDRGDLSEVYNLPNNHIVDNQFAKMVDQKANYLCGQPITFDAKNKAYCENLTRLFGKKEQRLLRVVAEKALIGGKAWVFPYYNNAGEFTLTMIPAHEVLPFWADAAHTELDCAVHLFPIYVYDEKGNEKIEHKVEVFHAGGVDRFVWENDRLVVDKDAVSGSYITNIDKKTGKSKELNWAKMPLICFKANHREIPLLRRVKCLQDALNLLLSNFANNMEEDVRNTILVLHNYDGENLGEFRRNLATYGAVKVRSFDGANGAVTTLNIEANAENYKTIIDMLKKAIIENARGYDAKDERMSGTPNQMNIRSMYSDIDLDANGMETEFQASFEDLLWFINAHLANTGEGNFDGEDVTVIFNRDILINETEAIDNCGKSAGIISNETIVSMHPWVDDVEQEMGRLRKEKEENTAEQGLYTGDFQNPLHKTPPNDKPEFDINKKV